MSPFFESLLNQFHELHQDIKQQLEPLPPEALDWKPAGEMNSISVIITHLTGAERFLVGDIILREPSNRNREAEFQVEGLGKQDLVNRLDELEAYLTHACSVLHLSDLETNRTHPRHGNEVTVAWALLHALDHVAIHTGHLQVTVQLWQLAQLAA